MSELVFRRNLIRHFTGSARTFPWRETSDPYAVLIGEILLQRTRGENVVAVYEDFIRRWPTARHLSRARPETIARTIRPLGLAKRAAQLHRLGRALGSQPVPLEPEELIQLPGVGPYAAHAVPTFAAGRNLPVVDWVIARVLRRYFGLGTGRRPNADSELWELADRLASRGRARELWLGTLDFANEICRPRPLCPECPLVKTCAFGQSLAEQTQAP